MAVIITLPTHRERTGTVAGIKFVDGTATVETLGVNKRAFLAAFGAEIVESEHTAIPQSADELETLPAKHLRSIAATREGITVPANASRDELIEALRANLFPEV